MFCTRARNRAHKRAPQVIVGWFPSRSSASFCCLVGRMEKDAPGKRDRNARRSNGRRRARQCRDRKSRAVIRVVSALPHMQTPDQDTAAGGGSAPTLRRLSSLRVGARNDARVCAFPSEFQTLWRGGVSVIASILGLTVHLQGAAARPCARTKVHSLPRAGATWCLCERVLERDSGALAGGLGGRLLSSLSKQAVNGSCCRCLW